MKKIFSILLINIIIQCGWAQSGEGYNPESPSDPAMYYHLTLKAIPQNGGKAYCYDKSYTGGERFYFYTTTNKGYVFKNWTIGDSIISTSKDFYLTMPYSDVSMTANFAIDSTYVYNPTSPEDPSFEGNKHRVSITAIPNDAGYFDYTNDFELTEGDSIHIYARPRSGYRFVSWKQNDAIISTSNPLKIKMGTKDLEYSAQFVYDPQNPQNPGSNNFNIATGELVIDDFEPGRLSSAINATMGDNDYSLIQSLVIAGKMTSSDLGFSYRMSNCSSIDLARTSGFNEIPSYCFESMSSLTKVVLPSCINSIGNSAFSGCTNLSEIDLYAVTPPNVYSSTFSNISSGVLIRVPSTAIDLYKANSAWNKFTILSLDDETSKITVCLPEDAKDGRYKNMTLELDNITNGQVLKMLISDKTNYTFNNLVCSTKYNIYVKNNRNVVLGSFLDVELDKEAVTKTFASLLQPQIIQVVVNDKDNRDITEDVSVIWTDAEGNYVSNESKLYGYVEGNTITYSIELSGDLALTYIAPQNQSYTVKDSDNKIVCKLNPLNKISLSGIVKDQNSGKLLQNATITFSQKLNGKHASSVVARTGTDGCFTATIYDAPVTMSASANNYIETTAELETVTDGMNVGEILMSRITGKVIDVNFTYSNNVEEGQSLVFEDEYSDYVNISYSVLDKTNNRDVEFIAQGTSIILTEVVPDFTTIAITALSKKDAFAPVTTDCVLSSEGKSFVSIPIIEWGDLQVSYVQSENAKNVVLLYDDKGAFISKVSYVDKNANLQSIKDGNYTLISMCNSSYFNTMLNKSEFSTVGLVEGTDYVSKSISVKSGYITKVVFETIPTLDLTKFYYTGNATQFTVNKQSVTVGNYITLRGDIDFKSEYVSSISNVKLIVDLPENCRFVDNSVLTSEGVASYSQENNRISVPLSSLSDNVRFCAVPFEAGSHTPSAFVQFVRNGETIVQPIGSAAFTASSLKISVPEKTAFTNVVVKGVAPVDSEVLIYDNGILVGKTSTLANGKWEAKVELYKPFAKSFHSFYAKVNTTNGTVLITDNKRLEYDRNYSVPAKISMLYNGKIIVFDQIERRNSTNSYSYAPSINDFTFIAEFTKNDAELIQNLEFVVLLSDGSKKTLSSEFSETKGKWIANAKFADTKRLPVNVKVVYDEISETNPCDNEMKREMDNALDYVLEDLYETFSKSQIEFLKNTNDELVFSAILEGTQHKEYFHITRLNYNDVVRINSGESFHSVKNETLDYSYKYDITETEIKYTYWNNKTTEALSICYQLNNPIEDFTPSNQHRILPFIISAGAGVIFAVSEYYIKLPEVEGWYETINAERDRWNGLRTVIPDLLNATCPDGSSKIKDPGKINAFYSQYQSLWKDVQTYLNNFRSIVDKERQMLKSSCTFKGALNVGLSAIGAGISGITSALSKAGTVNMTFGKETIGIASESLVPELVGGITEEVSQSISYITGEVIDGNLPRRNICDWYISVSRQLTDRYCNIITSIKSSYSECKEKEEEEEEPEPEDPKDTEDDFPNDNIQPSIDPSGYVYEGIASNRVEGVTATCYYKEQVEDMYGDLHDNIVKWDAEEFEQKNPLYTDKDGRYAWDVPQGLWQVKYEKEGYETAYSEWLPVPPPQLDVNIGIVQNRQPEVKEAHAYEDGVELTFDKYMMPAYLTTENIKVSQNGKYVDGKVVLVDEEVAYRDENVKYASTVRFVPNNVFSAGKEVTLVVANRVKSYAGIQMADNFTQSFDIEKEVKSIVADSLVKVSYQGSKVITLYVLPADAAVGKTMHADTSSDMIATLAKNDVTIDENGMAQFEINGELLGTTGITFSIEGVKATATVIVNVGDFNVSAINEPKASLVSGSSVYRGTKVSLTADSKDLKIWYTTDGTCPCDENGSRKQYAEPIVINSDMTLKAIAENADGEASDIATFVYKIMQSTSGVVLGKGWNWVTFNMKNETLNNVNDALSCGSWNIGDEIKNNLFTDSYSVKQDKWVGTLSKNGNISNAGMYMIHSTTAQTLNIIGEAIHPTETAINVGSGWNYIGYLPLGILSVTEALADYPAEENDVIKSQDAFAIYSSENGWNGSLETLHPGEGYMLKRANNAQNITFHYPATVMKNNTRVSKAKQHRYANNMNVIARVNGVELQQEDSIIAYADKEIRGCNRIDENGNIFLTIMGDEQADINLSVVRNGEVIASNNKSLKYEPNTIIGTAGKPTEINFVTDENTSLFQIAPNVIFDNMTIFINEQEIHSLLISVHNTSGLLVKEYSESHINGACERTLDMSELPTGIYLVKIIINDNSKIIKIIKK